VQDEDIPQLEQNYHKFKKGILSDSGLLTDVFDFFLGKNNNNGITLRALNTHLMKAYCIENLTDIRGDLNMLSICLVAQPHIFKELKRQNLMFNYITERNLNEVSPDFENLVKQVKYED